MMAMPDPISTPPPPKRSQGEVARPAMVRPSPVIRIEISTESRVAKTSYWMVTGRLTASMPMKCIAQMPPPMVMAAPASTALRLAPPAAPIPAARCRPV